MNVYEFQVGIWDRKRIYVLANNLEEALILASKYHKNPVTKLDYCNMYNKPQVIAYYDE